MKNIGRIKSLWCGVAAVMLLALAVGCSQKKVEVDTTNLDYAFQMAEPEAQAKVTAAIVAIENGQRADALAKLQAVSSDPKLTDEQKKAIQEVTAKLEGQ